MSPANRLKRLGLSSLVLVVVAGGLALAASGLTAAASSSAGVMVQPSAATQAAEPGEFITYTLRVTNTGSAADTFDFELLAGYTWPTTLTVPLRPGGHPLPFASGAGATITVTVTSPLTATGSDTVVVYVRSQADESISTTATLTTALTVAWLYLPLLGRTP